jgi:microcystin-dependent protein
MNIDTSLVYNPSTKVLNVSVSSDVSEVGKISMFARSTAPSGYLKCNGAAISRTTYEALFSAIGTTFGAGDGSTTFNIPDLRGEFIRGWDDARGVDAGRAFGSYQDSQLLKANRYYLVGMIPIKS